MTLQAKSRISRAQAALIFNRENPSFRKMNFANALPSKPAIAADPHPEKPIVLPPTRMSAVCQSPATGRLFAQEIEFTNSPTHEDTSENHATVRGEAQALFEEFRMDDTEVNLDRVQYEQQLKQHGKNLKRKNPESGEKMEPLTKRSQGHESRPNMLEKAHVPRDRLSQKDR